MGAKKEYLLKILGNDVAPFHQQKLAFPEHALWNDPLFEVASPQIVEVVFEE